MRFPFVLALTVLASAPSAAQDTPPSDLRPVAEKLADLELATAVRLALVADPRTRSLDVEVGARDGVVAVVGIEDVAYQQVAAVVARSVPGVRGLQELGEVSDTSVAEPIVIPALPRTHRVERGDTLFGIARRYNVSVDALRDLNDLRTDTIRVGQRLRLR
ncbi:MAG: LysM peptidoglycan-binding domain-containing protein [Bacteroidota bacterium]